MNIALWVNDALMAIFFLLFGLELEREHYVGEPSDFSNALLPIFAAIGGMAAPVQAAQQRPLEPGELLRQETRQQ